MTHMGKRCTPTLAAALLILLLAVATGDHARAADTGDAALGRTLTDRWCTSCHATSARGSDAAPPLAQLMRGKAADDRRLRGWLAAPHPPMRGIELSRQQTEDIIAYLRQLARS
jgi:cytochrome c2